MFLFYVPIALNRLGIKHHISRAPSSKLFSRHHIVPQTFGVLGDPAAGASPAVCCRQMVLLAEAHRAAGQHPTSTPA